MQIFKRNENLRQDTPTKVQNIFHYAFLNYAINDRDKRYEKNLLEKLYIE
jgi:hypothetical protein